MSEELSVPPAPHPNFESIKHVNDGGVEFWMARELMSVLEYAKWENFERVVAKAIIACENSGQKPSDHFPEVRKMIVIAKGGQVQVTDYQLSRYACYLVAQNGDPKKEAIALAQTYFAVQSRKQELLEGLPADQKRLLVRGEVTVQNKQLFGTARKAGVKNFGKFNEAGYKGLYGGLGNDAIRRRKKLGKDSLLDRAGAAELAANLFRITQTDEQLKKEGAVGEERATGTHYTIGRKVRKAIADIGGQMPENLPPEEHIKAVRKRLSGGRKVKKIPARPGGDSLAA